MSETYTRRDRSMNPRQKQTCQALTRGSPKSERNLLVITATTHITSCAMYCKNLSTDKAEQLHCNGNQLAGMVGATARIGDMRANQVRQAMLRSSSEHMRCMAKQG